MAGLLYSAARDRGIALTPNEVRQLMETTRRRRELRDQPESSCEPVALPTCTDPQLSAVFNSLVVSPLATTRRYPARKGHDQFYGHGRVNINAAVDQLAAGRAARRGRDHVAGVVRAGRPDGSRDAVVRRGAGARGAPYTCRVLVAPGSYPGEARLRGGARPPHCDGTARTVRRSAASSRRRHRAR